MYTTMRATALQTPFLEPLQNDRCSLGSFARQRIVCIRIRGVARPIMPKILVPIMHNHFVAPAELRNELVPSRSIAQRARLVVVDFESISLRPVIHPRDNVRRICVSARVDAARVADCCVFLAMELHDGHGQAPRLALWQLLRLAVEIESSRDGCECGNACCSDRVARQNATDEATAVGFTGSIDALGVYAEGFLEMVDELEREFHVVDVQRSIRIALPLRSFFPVLQAVVSTSFHSESFWA
jgi:hypothetical protein